MKKITVLLIVLAFASCSKTVEDQTFCFECATKEYKFETYTENGTIYSRYYWKDGETLYYCDSTMAQIRAYEELRNSEAFTINCIAR